MLLTITTTHVPATDLGFLLHKNPTRVHSAELPFGQAHMFYTEASESRCTAAVLIDIDPVGLVRSESSRFDQYVNDRPYVASSFMSSALSEFFSTAMGGRSKERPELAATPLPFQVHIPVLPSQGGETLLRELFEPLGYTVTATRLPLDEANPQWGGSSLYDVTLDGVLRVGELLTHLSVLIPVLDNNKHYWVGQTEIEKLFRRGGDWLAAHPMRELITRRYLRDQPHLTREALARLSAEDDLDPDATVEAADAKEEGVERPLSLHDIRLQTVHQALKDTGAKRVVDLGCGEGKLLTLLMKDLFFEQVLGMDVSVASLEKAARRLKLDRQPPRVAERMSLIHGSLVYRDARLHGFDGAAVVEVIEHLDPPRLASFERVVFEYAQPRTVVVTTPNEEYNVLFGSLHAGEMRHGDHRFEWTRAEFQDWSQRVAERFGYRVSFAPIGPLDETHGAPSQMAVFTLA